MKSNIIKYDNVDFIKIELLSVNQKGKTFYVGKLLGKDLLEIFTVKPHKYDFQKRKIFAQSFDDDENYYAESTNFPNKRMIDKEWQREINGPRVRDIRKFINENEYAFFPNTIIVTCDLVNNAFNLEPDVRFPNLGIKDSEIGNLSFFEYNDNACYLYVPRVRNALLIIDGQHRLEGLKEAKEDIKLNYEILLSFIIDFDRSIVAELFYTINYTQKSVNKSLLYQLRGEFSSELTLLTFFHEAAKLLNEFNNSPFYNRIKMLGIAPKDYPPEDKKRLTISQAFFIDYLLPTLSESSKRSIHPPIFLHYFKNKSMQIEIIRFINTFFNAVKKSLGTKWDDADHFIVSKTIGVGALIKVMHFVFVKMFIDRYGANFDKTIKAPEKDLIDLLTGIETVDWGSDGEFGKGTSAGSLNKLKKRIIEKINFFNCENYDDFLNIYRKDYLKKFVQKI